MQTFHNILFTIKMPTFNQQVIFWEKKKKKRGSPTLEKCYDNEFHLILSTWADLILYGIINGVKKGSPLINFDGP